MSNKQTTISKDAANKKLIVVREFDAPLEQVWKAWTDKDILDKWWAPKPWKAKTKSMDFREGGAWLYSMGGLMVQNPFAVQILRPLLKMKVIVVTMLFATKTET